MDVSGNKRSGDWKSERLGDVAEVIMGQSPPGNSYNSEGIGTPLINGPTEFTDKYPIKVQWTSQTTKVCKVGDLLLCVRGSSTGRINISDGEYCIGRGVAAIRARSGADTTFVIYQVDSAMQKLLALSAGSTFPNVDGKSIRSITIPLPSYDEQRAIATALSDVDALINSLDRLIAKKRDLKQAAMQELLTGKRRLPGFSGEWEMRTLGQLGDISGAGVDKKIRPGEIPVRLVNYLDVYRRDFIYSKELNHIVSAPIEQAARCSVKKGDIFFTPSSEVPNDIGISAVAMEDIPDAAYSYHVVRFRPTEGWDLAYRAYAFKSRHFLEQAERLCEGSGVRYVITQARFRQLTVLVPPTFEEQAAIATVLSDMDVEIMALQRKRGKTIALKQGMIQELLTGRIRLV